MRIEILGTDGRLKWSPATGASSRACREARIDDRGSASAGIAAIAAQINAAAIIAPLNA